MYQRHTEFYAISLDEKGAILSLTAQGKEFVSHRLPLFRIRLRNGGDVSYVTSDDATDVSFTEERDTDSGEHLTMTYRGFGKTALVVTVTVLLAEDLRWYVQFENKTGKVVEWIDFPQLAVPNDLIGAGGKSRILSGWNEGVLCEDIRFHSAICGYIEPEYPSMGLTGLFPAAVETQMLAYFENDGAGLYFAAHDAERNLKGVDYHEDGDGIKLQYRLYPGIFAGQTEYKASFPMVMRFFCGTWETAAQIYRDWFEAHLPEGLKPIEENADLPEWYTDSPLIVSYPLRGIHDMDEDVPNRLYPYANGLPYINALGKETASRMLTILMHWEGTAPWAPPYVWPPYGGAEEFRAFAAQLHQNHHLLGVYCSGTGYTIQSNINQYNKQEEFEKNHLSQYMCAAPDGSLPYSNICSAQRSGFDMCISQEFTKRTLCHEAEEMASGGVDYIQIFDQNHGGTPYFCYSDKHGHPPVPGKWQVDEMRDTLRRLKDTVGKNLLLGCESAAAEAYIPYLQLSDNRYNLNYYGGRPVPLYGYIYHRYLFNFSGNGVVADGITDVHKTPEMLLLRLAHSFVAGDLLTVIINDAGEIVWCWGQRDFSYLPPREQVISFIRSANAFRRHAGKKYLCYGEMVAPLRTACDREVAMVRRASPENPVMYPAVMTSAWRASDGAVAQFSANYTAQDSVCTIDFGAWKCAEIVASDGSSPGTLSPDGTGKAKLTVPALSVLMLEFH